MARRASPSWRATPRPSPTRAATSPACRRASTKHGRRSYVLNGQKAGSPTRASRASTSSSRPRTPSCGTRASARSSSHRDAQGPQRRQARGQARPARERHGAGHARRRARARRRRCSRRPGHGFKLAMETFNQTRPDIGAIACGPHAPLPRRVRRLRQGAQDVRHRRSRNHQLVQAMIAEMAIRARGDAPARTTRRRGTSTRASAIRSSRAAPRPTAPTRRCSRRPTPCRSSAATAT